MKSTTLLALVSLTSFTAWAAEDLQLPGARWATKPVGYVCEAAPATVVGAPATLNSIGVVFQSLVTDLALSNGLLKATFVEDGTTCRYSALIQADYTTRLLTLLDSRAFAADESSACTAGKTILDAALAADRFTYWGQPRHLTFLVDDTVSAPAICGEGATSYGIDFVLTGAAS